MSNEKYKQCKLSRKIDNGKLITVRWIPIKSVIKNNIIKLKNDKNEWNVDNVYNNIILTDEDFKRGH